MADELKPCPFCGGEAQAIPKNFALGNAPKWILFGVVCRGDCGTFFDCRKPSEAEAIAAWNTRPAPKADSALVGELREKAEQADAAKRNLHGLPVLAMGSDTHKGKLALWCDNGLAGVGQACVAVNLGEFPDEQIKAIAALANIAATTDFATILAALSDRDVVLEANKRLQKQSDFHDEAARRMGQKLHAVVQIIQDEKRKAADIALEGGERARANESMEAALGRALNRIESELVGAADA